MTRAGLVCLLIGVFVFECQREKLPAGVLSKEDYAALLVDVYLAEARLNALSAQRDSLSKIYFPHEQKLLQQKGLPDSVVLRTYQYYLNHPADLEEVYSILIDTLSLREQRYGGTSLN